MVLSTRFEKGGDHDSISLAVPFPSVVGYDSNNKCFLSAEKCRITWMCLRSKDWHLIYNAFGKKKKYDAKDVYNVKRMLD